jgi:hypothetical protein
MATQQYYLIQYSFRREIYLFQLFFYSAQA